MPFTKGDYEKTKNIFNQSALLREKTHSKRGNATYFNQTYKKKLEEPQIRDNVEKLLKDEKDIIISSKKFDADDTLLNAPNCVIKLDKNGIEVFAALTLTL